MCCVFFRVAPLRSRFSAPRDLQHNDHEQETHEVTHLNCSGNQTEEGLYTKDHSGWREGRYRRTVSPGYRLLSVLVDIHPSHISERERERETESQCLFL